MADNVVTNNYRMRMTIPTIKYCLKWRARVVVILAHFRDPQGRRDSELSLKPICDEMASLLGETVGSTDKTRTLLVACHAHHKSELFTWQSSS